LAHPDILTKLLDTANASEQSSRYAAVAVLAKISAHGMTTINEVNHHHSNFSIVRQHLFASIDGVLEGEFRIFGYYWHGALVFSQFGRK